MKKNKIGLILTAVLLIACVALAATACNPGDDDKPKTYTLSFVADGETVSSIVSEAGKDITPPTAPEKEDMNFIGWFLNNEGEAAELPTVMPAENRTYHARYEPIDDGGDEEEIKIPEEYTLKLDEIDSDNHLYIDLDGTTVYIEYGGKVIKSELSVDGNYVEFTLNRKDYCAVLDGTAKYGVYEYGFPKDSYTLYLPMNNSFNRERILVFNEDNTFEIVGDYYGNVWASGTYSVINPSTQEYSLTVVEDNSYGNFGSCQVKLTKRVRQSNETGAKPLVYNAFNIFDEEIYGSFTNSEGETLSLDGYGYASYTDKNGNSSFGYCELADILIFSEVSTYYTVIDAAGGKSTIYLVEDGAFAEVGSEIGLYRVYDVVNVEAGSYYFLIDGFGSISVWYGESVEYYPEINVASATYEVLENGEIKYTFIRIIDSAQIDEPYTGTFNFKLTTYGSGMYKTDAFAIYNPEIAGTWSAENGASTIVLDGYGNAAHNDSGSIFSGAMQIDTDLHLFLITDENDNQRIFRFNDENDPITYRQIGIEIGTYDLYSYANGFSDVYIYLDGENRVDYYVFDEETDKYYVAQSGTYQATENEDEYEIELEDESKFKIATREVNLGSSSYPAWYTIFVVYDENLAGTFTGNDGATLTLDGYGFSATFRDSDGFVFEGEFAKEWNVVTLLSYDDEDNARIFTFRITGNKFAIRTNEAGVYYNFILDSDYPSDKTRIILGGDGTAYYTHYEKKPADAVGHEATYTYDFDVDIHSEVYTLTFNDNTATVKFVVTVIGTTPVFIEYNENWAGTFTNVGGSRLVLDGYGRAIYNNDTSEIVFCTVFGESHDAVTFFYDIDRYTFILDRENHTFTRTADPIGVYYPYDRGKISGYDRMVIGTNNQVEIQTFDKASQTYGTTDSGTYSKDGKIFSFTSASGGEDFSFKLDEVGGYDVFRVADGFDTAPLKGEMTLDDKKTKKTTVLTLDGYGSATYNFFYTDDGMPRERTGYYYYSDEELCLIFVATNEKGEEYCKYYISVDWDNHTFEILLETSPNN